MHHKDKNLNLGKTGTGTLNITGSGNVQVFGNM